MRARENIIDRIAAGFFRAQSRAQRTPHPLFLDLYARVHRALDEAELCLHADVTSRPNVLEVFFEFETWGQYVAARQTQVERALEAEIEAHRRRAAYGDDERVVLRMFVADPAQLEVHPLRPEVVARRVPDPFALDDRWQAALKHTTVIGPRSSLPPSAGSSSSSSSTRSERAASATEPATVPTPLAILEFDEAGARKTELLFGPAVFGRGSDADVRIHADPRERYDVAEIVSRRALALSANAMSGALEVKNIGRWPLDVRSEKPLPKLAPDEVCRVDREAELLWPGDAQRRFSLLVRAPRRGTLYIRSKGREQAVVLRAPRTYVQADPALFEGAGIAFNVDFVDGTRFLVLNNEGLVPLRLGALEGKQIQWPIDAPREIEAGDLAIAIVLEEAR